MQQSPRKILLIRLSSLGDVLLTTPAIQALRRTFPESEIDFLTRKPSEPLVRHLPELNRVWIYDEDSSNRRRQIQQLKASTYDVVIDWQANLRSREFHGVASKLFSFKKFQFRRFFYVKFKFPFSIPSVPERYIDTLQPLGVTDQGESLKIQLPVLLTEAMKKKFDEWKGTSRGPVFFIAAGARHTTKKFPVEYHVELMKMLLELQPFARFILLGGPDEMEEAFRIKKDFPDNQLVWNATGGFSIPESLALLSLCTAGFSNDSFLMHAATALRVPVIAFFGSTTRKLGFSPFRSTSLVVEDESVSCRPCSHIGRNSCPKGHFQCMKNLTPESRFPQIYSFIFDVLEAGVGK